MANKIRQILIIGFSAMAILFYIKGLIPNSLYCLAWAILTQMQIKNDATINIDINTPHHSSHNTQEHA